MLKSLTPEEINFMQIIEDLPDGKIRIYNIIDGHMGDEDDPLTTIHVAGYQDIEP